MTAILATVAVLIIGSCSSSPTSSNQTGELRIRMIDSPAEFQHVYIVVNRVDVHMAGSDSASGWVTINNVPATHDLLTLQNGASAVLGDQMLAVGKYTQIRLLIGAESNVVVNNAIYPLQMPSGMQTGIKLNNEFDIAAGALYELQLDFSVDQSIHKTGNGIYMMIPVIRVEAAMTSGTISGTVLPFTARAIVAARNVTDTVSTYADSTNGAFMIMALPAGIYSVAITPTDTLLADTTITYVQVGAQQNTDLGTITLRVK